VNEKETRLVHSDRKPSQGVLNQLIQGSQNASQTSDFLPIIEPLLLLDVPAGTEIAPQEVTQCDRKATRPMAKVRIAPLLGRPARLIAASQQFKRL
jgi:hypothetical protein